MIFGKIRTRLLAGFVLLSPLPLAGLAYLQVDALTRALNATVLTNLSAIADKKDDQIAVYMDERLADGQALANSVVVSRALPLFSRLVATAGTSSARYLAEERRHRAAFQAFVTKNPGYHDMLLVGTSGVVVFSVKHEPDLGSNLNSGPYRESAFAHAHREALALLAAQITPVQPYAPSGGKPAMFIVTPVLRAGKPIGTVALQLDVDQFLEITADTTGLGKSGKTLLAQRDNGHAIVIGPLGSAPEKARRQPAMPAGLTEPMKAAFDGGYGAGLSHDPGRVDIVAAWRYLPALRSGMVVKMDAAEAFAPARRLRAQAASALLVLLFFSGISAFAFGHAIVAPIRKLMTVTRRIAEGDLAQRATVEGMDELRELATSFNRMADRISRQHATLEQRVAQRTAELQDLNATLELRIAEAVHRNVEQERMLIQQSRHAAMGEMIGNIAHQWRQPLQAIALILGNIKDRWTRRELNDESLQAEIEHAKSVLKQMSKTVDDFRSFFRPDRAPEAFDMDSPVKEALSIMGAALQNNKIDVSQSLELGLKAYGYPHQFAQAILNVIANAKQAIQERNVPDGRIEITLARSQAQGVLTIQDNGGGIPEDALPKIFDPFFTTRNQGSGIGLYMTKTIVERNHRGEIRAENHGPGARITISLPLPAEGAEP